MAGFARKRCSLIKWCDKLERNKSIFKRIIKPYNLYIDVSNGRIEYVERKYEFPDMILPYKEYEMDEKYGSLDLETFIKNDNVNRGSDEELKNINIEDLGLGIQEAYAGGWKINGIEGESSISEYFIIDYKTITNSEDLIKAMFKKLFENKINNYKLFVHNLGRFDAIFLIKHLVILGYDISPLWKDNAVLQIKVYDPESKQKIIILDSINFLSVSLKKLLVAFNCNVRKGVAWLRPALPTFICTKR
jgi:hypothetical protein